MAKRRKWKKCIDVKSPFRQTVFYERDRKRHEDKHPELKSDHFLKQVKKTINRPLKVYRSFINPTNVFIFYGKIGVVKNPINPEFNYRFIKVVIALRKHKANRVLTAFGINYIKEKKEVYIRR